MITTKSAQFLKSITHISDAPAPIHSEVAFLGRSNVGKSTLINKILESNLAKSSSTPGKTRLINFFKTIWEDSQTKQNLTLHLIDLPGVGYAKVSKAQMQIWQKNLWDFITKRSNIKLFIHLIDSRHTNLQIDKDLRASLESFIKHDQAIVEIFTKADKLSKNDLAKLRQKKALIIGNNDTILPSQHSAKQVIKECIFTRILRS